MHVMYVYGTHAFSNMKHALFAIPCTLTLNSPDTFNVHRSAVKGLTLQLCIVNDFEPTLKVTEAYVH